MSETAESMPKGFVVTEGGVLIRPKRGLSILCWASAALCLVVAVGMPLDTARRAAAGKDGIELGGVFAFAAVFALIAGGMVWLGVWLARPAWVVEAGGLRKLSPRRAFARWDQVTAIEMKLQGRVWQVWVHTPGGVEGADGRPSRRKRLIVPVKILAPHPQQVHTLLTERWQAARGQR